MYSYTYGGKEGIAHNLVVSDSHIAVRTRNDSSLADAATSEQSKRLLEEFTSVLEFPEADVYVLDSRRVEEDPLQLRDAARAVLGQEKNVRFAGRVLLDADSGEPVVYTENFFIQFRADLNAKKCRALLKDYSVKYECPLQVKERLRYAKNAYFICAPEGTGRKVFEIAQQLLSEPEVEFCHPELVRGVGRRMIAPQQWHLKRTVVNVADIDAHINVEAAWRQGSQGAGVVIAVIDDGVDIDHEEFNVAGKVVHPRDTTLGIEDPRPKMMKERHGTACAGVACAAGKHQAAGVAPEAQLMPIRFASALGSKAEAEAIYWAASKGADVISCSWGPVDGAWNDPEDTRHQDQVALPDMTRQAIDYALTRGRRGKGCVIVWAAGNGNESVENDGYASYDPIIAVAACNDSSRRSVYSDYGSSIWCCFPSDDKEFAELGHPPPQTPGIWTTDRSGWAGYNPGKSDPISHTAGDVAGHYTDSFGGTSSACPGVAGIAALILAHNSRLHHSQVKEILRRSCVMIDSENGAYDQFGHSRFYGYGRPDAAKAVALAIELQNGHRSLDDELALFEAITFEVTESAIAPPQLVAQNVARQVLGTVWRVEQVEHSPTEFDALYKGRGKIDIGKAWELTYRLRRHNDVRFAEPSFVVPIPGVTDVDPDALEGLQRMAPRMILTADPHHPQTGNAPEWSLELVKARAAWQLSSPTGKTQGEGVVIGHPDSGYRSHPELNADRILVNLAQDFLDDDPTTGPNDPGGNHGLGTATVLLSGEDRVDDRLFVTGVAPKAKLVPLRVTTSEQLLPAPVLLAAGMRRLRQAINYAVDKECSIISMSLGGPFGHRSLRRAIQRAVEEGVIVLAAAGNVVPWVVLPAAYDEVIAVAACTVEGKPWELSSRGRAVDVTAPGASVWRAVIAQNGQPTVSRSSGTSFSVAITAGIAALWLAYHGRENLIARYGKAGLVKVFKELLVSEGCDPNEHLDPLQYGAGIVNAVKVLQAELPALPPAASRRAATSVDRQLEGQSLERFTALFENVPESVLRAQLMELLQTDGAGFDGMLAEVGDEIAYRFMLDPELRDSFASVLRDEGDPQQIAERKLVDRTSEERVQNVRVRLARGDISKRLRTCSL